MLPITHLLLDIEGTTCPVSFVAEVLFPYARQQLRPFLERRATEPAVAGLIEETEAAWALDPAPEAQALLQERNGRVAISSDSAHHARGIAVAAYLDWLIATDRKFTPLKELQGMLWQAGYASGQLQAPLFADVPDALQRWKRQGLTLAVYSSGSVPAQQLLYRYSNAGDLRSLFSHWFDTRTGPKQESQSYEQIAKAMAVDCRQVLFISDSPAEVKAAAAAGMAVRFSQREGNPHEQCEGFATISDYGQLCFDD